MYKFSTDTVLRANEKLKKSAGISSKKSLDTDYIDVSVNHDGKIYKKRITMDEIRNAYGRALKELSL